MDERELPSDSDTSDEDFVPDGADSDVLSEEESGPDDAELEKGVGSGDDESKKETPKGKKRSLKKKGAGKKKRLKKNTFENVQEQDEGKSDNVKEQPIVSEEEEKKKADNLWADFMKDVGARPTRKPAVGSSPKVQCSDEKLIAKTPGKPTGTPSTEKENKVTVTKLFEFAGEEVRVTQEVDANSAEARLLRTSSDGAGHTSKSNDSPQGRGRGRGLSGISSVLSQIGKKAKISTLEKSKLDWERFKAEQGLQEEIVTHNRGKDGYLEKQDFLQRTDLRQFEIEKQLRASRRSNR